MDISPCRKGSLDTKGSISKLLNLRPDDLGFSWNQMDLKYHSKSLLLICDENLSSSHDLQ